MTTDLTISVLPVERQKWFIGLVDECKDILTETEFVSRWALVEGYHSLGSCILQENENFERAKVYGENIVQCVAESLNKKPRTVYYAMQFAKMYPDLNLLPEGKNISWHHIVNKYLTTGGKKVTINKADLYQMIKEIKQLLITEALKEAQSVFACEPSEFSNLTDFIRYLQDQVDKITQGVKK